MKNPSLVHSLLVAGPLVGLSSAFGALAEYRFDAASQGAIGTDPNIVAGLFGPGAGLDDLDNGTSGGNVTNYTAGHARVSANRVIGTSTTAGTEAASFAGGECFQFQVEATSGYQLNLTQLKFSTNYYSVDAVTFASYFVRCSLDNYTTNLGVTATPEFDGVFSQPITTSSATFTERTIALGPEFQNLQGPVTFQIYVFDTNNSTARWVAIDDVIIDGTVTAIPEPSGAALLLSGGMLALLGRRKR